MQGKYKWLLLPPALALFLFLGPLREPTSTSKAQTPTTAQTPSPGSGIPVSPSLTQIVSTTIGVLLLGVVIVLAIGRTTRRGGGGGNGTLSLRQTLRLSGRHAVHLVQMDAHLLLLGECDGSVSVLERMEDPAAAEEGAQLEEDGAVPRDLIIPRPATKRQTAPKRPRNAPAKPADLARFQTVLQAARKATQKV